MDERPPVWIGPAVLHVSDLEQFSVRDPDGHLLTVNSSHVAGPV